MIIVTTVMIDDPNLINEQIIDMIERMVDRIDVDQFKHQLSIMSGSSFGKNIRATFFGNDCEQHPLTIYLPTTLDKRLSQLAEALDMPKDELTNGLANRHELGILAD